MSATARERSSSGVGTPRDGWTKLTAGTGNTQSDLLCEAMGSSAPAMTHDAGHDSPDHRFHEKVRRVPVLHHQIEVPARRLELGNMNEDGCKRDRRTRCGGSTRR